MFKKNPEKEAVVAKLADYLVGLPDGEEVSWLRIESDTGVKMSAGGKDAVRRALGRLNRPYEAVRGVAVRLSSASSALAVMHGRCRRIDGEVRIAERTQKQLAARHLPQMSNDEQRKMILLGGFFGAIRTMAKQNAPIFS